MSLIEKLKSQNFEPSFTKDRHERDYTEDIKNYRILAEAVNSLIEEKGPQFLVDLYNEIEYGYEKMLPSYAQLTSILKHANPFYKEFQIKNRQLFKIFREIYPNIKITSCKGVQSTQVVLYKHKKSLKDFVNNNFSRPEKGYRFWAYLPKEK